MFLDKDQFEDSSGDEKQKKQQKQTQNNQYNFLYEIQSDSQNLQQEKSKLIQEKLGQLKQKQEQQKQQLGVIKNTQFQQNVEQNIGDMNSESQLLLASQNSQMQYEPGLPQTSQIPKLHEQAAHISMQQKIIEKQQNNEDKNKEIQLSEEKDSQDEEIQEQQQYNLDEDKEDEEKEQELIKPTAPIKFTPTQKENDYILKLLNESNIGNLKEFVTKPCPKGYLIQCTVIRKKGGFGWLYPKYHLFLSNGKKYLMSAKKKSLNKTSNYVISLSQDNFNIQSEYAVGKVRSNFMGTEFKIYDNGLNPKKCHQWNKVRAEIGAVIYESNMLGNKGPRKMKVFTPEVQSNEQPVKFKPLKKEDGIIQSYKVGKREGIKTYYNKNPKWNEQAQAFVLNFHGRIDKASVKNFQLVDKIDDEVIYMQFGRIANQQFNLDLQYPLSLVQAFGIALSSFDYKLACE